MSDKPISSIEATDAWWEGTVLAAAARLVLVRVMPRGVTGEQWLLARGLCGTHLPRLLPVQFEAAADRLIALTLIRVGAEHIGTAPVFVTASGIAVLRRYFPKEIADELSIRAGYAV